MSTTAFPSGTDNSSGTIPGTGANPDIFLGDATDEGWDHPDNHQLLASATEAIEYHLRNGGGGIWDVRTQGAVCDRVTDDTAAIQLTIEACSLAGGGVVWVPKTAAISNTLFVRPGVFLHVVSHTIGISQVGAELPTTVDDYNQTAFDWWDDPYQNGLVWIGPNGGGPMVMMQPDFDHVGNVTAQGVGKGVPLTGVGFTGQLIAGTNPSVSAAAYGLWVCGVKDSVFGPISVYEFQDGGAGVTVTGRRFGSTNPTDPRYGDQSVVANWFPLISGRQTLNNAPFLAMDGWDNSVPRQIVSASAATPTLITLDGPHGAVSGGLSVIITGSTTTPSIDGTYKIKAVTGPSSFTLMTTGNSDVIVTVGGAGGTCTVEHAAGPDPYQNGFGLIGGLHRDGLAVDLGYIDHNRFYAIRLERQTLGTGVGVLLRAFSDRPAAASNDFHRLRAGGGGMVVQGTATGARWPGEFGLNRVLAWDPDLSTAGRSKDIRSVSAENPTKVTMKVRHLYATGQSVVITGSNSTPTIDGTRVVTVLNDTQFTVPVSVSGAGTAAGSVMRSTFFDAPPPDIQAGADLIWYDRRDTNEPMVGSDLPNIPTLPVQQSQFPNQADGGRRWFHTTKRMGFFYSHSDNWLSEVLYTENMQCRAPLAASGIASYAVAPFSQSSQWIWLENIDVAFVIAGGTPLSGSHFWKFDLEFADASTAVWQALGTLIISTGASDVIRATQMPISLSPPRIDFPAAMLRVNATKNGTPGTADINVRINYRMLAFPGFPYWY